MRQLTSDEIQRLRSVAKGSLYAFAKGVLGFSWLNPRIHLPLCRLLENPANRRLCICLPRGWLKTTLCSQAYPLWRAIRDPNVRILLVQNTYSNAVSKNLVIKKIVETNELFRALFPELLPDGSCTWKNDSLHFKRSQAYPEGTFDAAGAGTQVVSRHCDVIIEDDTVAPNLDDLGEENLAPTKDEISQAIGWHRLAPPLLSDQSQGQIIVVGTRWFEKDLISWVRQNEPWYTFYFRACLEDSRGEPDEAGEVAYPERFDRPVLDELRAALGPYMFSCLYLNKPLRSDDMIFRPEWLSYYETEPASLMCWTTVDPGGDPEMAKGETDFSVVLTCGKDLLTGDIYVLDYTRERCNPGALVNYIFDHVRRWNPVLVGIEAVQYQKALFYWVRERMRSDGIFFRVEPVQNNQRSKEVRIRGLQPLFANNVIHLRRHMRDLVGELLIFPLGAHDDLPDALSMQLGLWRATRSADEDRAEVLASHPLSVDAAINEIRSRGRERYGGVLDVLDCNRLLIGLN